MEPIFIGGGIGILIAIAYGIGYWHGGKYAIKLAMAALLRRA
jgi:hypothetical protein